MFERMVELLGGNGWIIMLVLLPVLFQVGMGVLYLLADALGRNRPPL